MTAFSDGENNHEPRRGKENYFLLLLCRHSSSLRVPLVLHQPYRWWKSEEQKGAERLKKRRLDLGTSCYHQIYPSCIATCPSSLCPKTFLSLSWHASAASVLNIVEPLEAATICLPICGLEYDWFLSINQSINHQTIIFLGAYSLAKWFSNF